jgi:hypothetical protein
MVLVPNPHDLVHAATVNTAGQAAHLLDEVMEKRGAGHKFLMVDITIQGLIQSKDQLGHVITSYPLNASKNRKTDAAIGHPNRYSTRLSDIAATAPCGTKCHFSAAWNLVAPGHIGH